MEGGAGTAGALGAVLLSGALTSSAQLNTTLSLDVNTAGNSYSDPGTSGNNSMTVGTIDNCLTTATGNPALHNHLIQVIVQNIHDLVGWQARINYLGDQWRPNTVNFTPFNDTSTAQSLSFVNLPIDSTTTTIRYVDFMHNTEIPWWNPSLSYLQVVSPMSVLANLASRGNMPAFDDVLRLIPAPSPGGTMPRGAR